MKPNIPLHTGDRHPNWTEGDPIPDFESVLEAAQQGQNGGFRNPRTWWLLGAAAVLALFAWIGTREEEPAPPALAETQHVSNDTTESVLFSGPMSLEWQVAPAAFTFPSEQDCYILTDDGVGLTIPAGSFETSADSVTVEITLLNDVLKVFTSGIPMNYDSAGVTYGFMSDGMVRLQAHADGSAVHVSHGAQLQLEVPADQDSTQFNQYSLDASQNWTFEKALVPVTYATACEQRPVSTTGTSAAATHVPTPNYAALANLETELRALSREAPLKPVKANPAQDHFNLDILPGEFPELDPFIGMDFEVRGPGFHPDYFEQIWEDFDVERIPESNQFRVTLKSETATRSFNVVPVVASDQFDAALNAYEEKAEQHSSQTAKLKAQIAQEKRTLEALEQQAEAARIRPQNGATLLMSSIAKDMDPYRMVRVLDIGSLGVLNVDKPIPLPRVKPVSVDICVRYDGQVIRPEEAMLCDAKRKQYTSLRGENLTHLRYLDKWDNYLLSSLDGNQLLLATPDQFNALDRKAPLTQLIELRVIDQPMRSLEELLDYLALEASAGSETHSR